MTSHIPPKNKVVITDTSCFVLLKKIEALDILPRLFEPVITTPEIANEYGQALPDWVVIHPANQFLKEEYLQQVDEGEASAIALAQEIDCDYLIIDDLAARKLAQKLRLPVKGTVGVILSAKLKGIIPSFRTYLNMIQQTNFRLSERLAEQFIKEAGE